MSEDKIKGYIIQGCTGYYFSDEPSSYSCEYCGSHFTMGEIDGMESLIDYSIGETFSSWLDIEGQTVQQVKNKLEGDFDENPWYFVSNFEHNMAIVLDNYHIKADELLKLAMDYVDRVYDELSGEMKIKVDFRIVTAPVYVDLMCPYCDSENTYDYGNLQEKVGTEVYFGNHGEVDCQSCGEGIELGDVEYD